MSSRQTPTGFTLSDLLVRIIPGITLSAPFFLPLSGYIIESYFWNGQSLQWPEGANFTIILLVFAIITLIVGEFVDLVRNNLVPVPSTFRKIVYNDTKDRKSLSTYQRIKLYILEYGTKSPRLQQLLSFIKREVWDVNKIWFSWSTNRYGEIEIDDENPDAGFLDYYRRKMDFESTFSNSRILYKSLCMCLDGQMSSMTKQYQTTYNSVTNFQIAYIGGVASLVVHYGMGYFTENVMQQVIALVFFIPFSLIGICVIAYVNMFTNVRDVYIESLMIEYLMIERPR